MPKHATIQNAERKMRELASPEEMARREQIAARLDSYLDRPINEAEKKFWREFEARLFDKRP